MVNNRLKNHFLFKSGISLFLLSVLTLSSCSDELEVKSNNTNDITDGTLQIHLNIASPEVVTTRSVSDEEKLVVDNDYGMYFFCFRNENGVPNSLVMTQAINSLSVNNTITINVPEDVKSTSDFTMVIVANAPKTLFNTDPATYSVLLSKTTAVGSNNKIESPYIMSGLIYKDNNTFKVDLKRSIGKISIENTAANFVLDGFTMFKGALNGYATAAIADEKESNGSYKKTADGTKIFSTPSNTISFTSDVSDSNRKYVYSYPVESAGKDTQNLDKAYFIIKGKYKDQTCYYRIDLKSTDGYYNVEPNHWYQITIKSVNSYGYASYEEAAKRYMGQENDITVEIHDHSANVMSMIADGTHELGASRRLYYDPNEKDKDNKDVYSNDETYLTVRFYCASEGNHTGHIPSDGKTGSNFKIEYTDNWYSIDLDNPIPVGDNDELSGEESTTDKESKGTRYKYKVTFYPDKIAEGEGSVRISWLGMSMEIQVIYKKDFDATKILNTTKLTMHDGSNSSSTKEQDDYWEFLKNTVKGVSATAMGEDKQRNEGFHFPVMYGSDSSKPWWYEYSFSLKDVSDVKGYSFKLESDQNKSVWDDLKIVADDDTDFTIGSELGDGSEDNPFQNRVSTNSTSFTLSKPSKADDWDYSVAELTMRIFTGENTYVDKKFNLYHTGFFHEDESKSEWYYYEVVELANGKHWLDRNIGASSNGLYIQKGDNSSLFGINDGYPFCDNGAGGGYVKIAEGVNYKSPDFTIGEDICPPGFRIPTQSEFDKLRASSDFITSSQNDASAAYYTAYYASADAGPIYFPKGKFKNGESWAGDALAGYYWTQTEAAGLEKEQIGHWVKAFYINGNSTSYINGDVDNYAMNLRCIEGSGIVEETKYTVGFKVNGATHVMMYSIVDGVRTELFTFPGKGINTSLTTDQLFTYTSTIPVDNLYVYFTYTDENGKVWVIYPRTANSDDPKFSYLTAAVNIKDFSTLNGWKVKNNENYFFKSGDYPPTPYDPE